MDMALYFIGLPKPFYPRKLIWTQNEQNSGKTAKMKGKFEVQVEANKRVFTQNFTVFERIATDHRTLRKGAFLISDTLKLRR